MLSPSTFRDLVSGRRRDWLAAIFRAGAATIEPLVAGYARWRNRRFDKGIGVVRVPAPVVSIGNLTLGGVGKTPLVAWIAKEIAAQGRGVTLVSRGYGRDADGLNDEARELARRLPGVPHALNPDRVAAASAALAKHPDHAIVLDDAFQHRRIARDLDVVVLDSLEPFGFERVFPRGTLREALEELKRADFVILSRVETATPETITAIRERVEHLAPGAGWATFAVEPTRLVAADGTTADLLSIKEKRVAAFCGLGNPAGFRSTIESLVGPPVAWREFPDHHPYRPGDVADLARWANQSGAEVVVCTGKDLSKLADARLGEIPLFAIEIDIRFRDGEVKLKDAIAKTLSRHPA